MKYEYFSWFTVNQEVVIGDIKAHVSGVTFDANNTPPKVEITWFVNGDVKTAWVREESLRLMVK